MKIFWSWQSDTPGKTGRHFVRQVLLDAIHELKEPEALEEPSEREREDTLHLDHDRHGVTGSPDLFSVILAKIDSSAVFIADVTPVSKTPGYFLDGVDIPEKRNMNPNVAIELGYALKALTDRNLLMVLNTFYGDRKYLPFDLAHKAGPIMFHLPPDANKATLKAEAASLRGQLIVALRPFLLGIKRIVSWGDEEVESLRQLHERFSPGVQDPFDSLITWVEDNARLRRSGKAKLDEYLIVAKRGPKLVGYLYATYYNDSKYLLISYFAVIRKAKEGEGAVKLMFLHLGRYVRNEYPDWKGMFGELEHEKAPGLKRIFRINASHAQLRGYEICIDYLQPKISPDLNSEAIPLSLILFPNEAIDSDRMTKIDKNTLLEILRFIYLQIYWDTCKGDDDICKQYRQHLSDLYKQYERCLPCEVRLRSL